jgi:N-acetylmuramoyl-L-alanine amidase
VGYDKKPIMESILNLEVSKLAYDKLKDKFNIFLTRKSDSCVNWKNIDYNHDKKITLADELLSRIEFAKEKNADYVLSLHFNASRDKSKEGIQIFYPAIYNRAGINNNKTDFCANAFDCSSYSESSYRFAEDLSEFFQLKGFKVEICGADYRILIGNQKKKGKINYPLDRIILLEFGYMTNKEDYLQMTNPEGQEKYASLLQEFFDYMYPEKLERKEIKINYGKQISQLTYLR